MIEYDIITARGITELKSLVSARLNDGWQLVGTFSVGPCDANGIPHLAQAMTTTRPDSPPEGPH